MKVLIVDDDPLICRSLERILSTERDIVVTGIAADGAEALDRCRTERPDLVLMDIRMPGTDGIRATRLIKERFPSVRVVMLTTFGDRPNIATALRAGADGYLLKTEPMTGLAGKLRTMFGGAAVLDHGALEELAARDIAPAERLTPREHEVLSLVTEGFTNREIAERLFLSEGTVRNAVSALMAKLNAKNRTHLSRIAEGPDLPGE
jgi:NarL family two-component system response regulator LiaR